MHGERVGTIFPNKSPCLAAGRNVRQSRWTGILGGWTGPCSVIGRDEVTPRTCDTRYRRNPCDKSSEAHQAQPPHGASSSIQHHQGIGALREWLHIDDLLERDTQYQSTKRVEDHDFPSRW